MLDGRTAGHVEHASLTSDGRTLRGVTVRHGFGSARWVDAADIAVLGQAAVIIARKPGKRPRDADFSLTTVWDTAGMPIGRVTDAYLCGATRCVQALELSLSPLETLRHGRFVAREFAVMRGAASPGSVMIPCGCVLERAAAYLHAKEVKE